MKPISQDIAKAYFVGLSIAIVCLLALLLEPSKLQDHAWVWISYSTWKVRPPQKPWAEEGFCDVLIAEESECEKFRAALGSFNESFRDLHGFNWAIDAVEDEDGNRSVQFVVEGVSERSGQELCDWVARRGLDRCKVKCPDNLIRL
jgi:hypothetical protein